MSLDVSSEEVKPELGFDEVPGVIRAQEAIDALTTSAIKRAISLDFMKFPSPYAVRNILPVPFG